MKRRGRTSCDSSTCVNRLLLEFKVFRRYSRPPFLPLAQVLSVFRGFHTEGVCQVCFSPDGKVKVSFVTDKRRARGHLDTCGCS